MSRHKTQQRTAPNAASPLHPKWLRNHVASTSSELMDTKPKVSHARLDRAALRTMSKVTSSITKGIAFTRPLLKQATERRMKQPKMDLWHVTLRKVQNDLRRLARKLGGVGEPMTLQPRPQAPTLVIPWCGGRAPRANFHSLGRPSLRCYEGSLAANRTASWMGLHTCQRRRANDSWLLRPMH